jgi:hypothetical protein
MMAVLPPVSSKEERVVTILLNPDSEKPVNPLSLIPPPTVIRTVISSPLLLQTFPKSVETTAEKEPKNVMMETEMEQTPVPVTPAANSLSPPAEMASWKPDSMKNVNPPS